MMCGLSVISLGFVLGILSFAIGVATYTVYRRIAVHTMYPYEWRCPAPGCTFRVRSNKMEIIEATMNAHTVHKIKGRDA